MKIIKLIPFVILLLQNNLVAQLSNVKFTEKNLESKILTYQPIQKEGISDEKFSKGTFILGQVKNDVKDDQLIFNRADYWNITVAFLNIGEPKEHIAIAFEKAISNKEDADAICEYFESFGEKGQQLAKQLTQLIPDIFIPFSQNCMNISKVEEKFDSKIYSKKNNLKLELVQLMNQIGDDDQRYRKLKDIDWSKQTPLDEKNMRLIDSLFNHYQKYIGNDLVGDDLEVVMWAVIQHSKIETMEKYLPVLHEAVKKGTLHPNPFKMMLDRIHCYRHNYQFFGSQFGGDCKIASEEKIKAIKEKYNLK